MFRYIRSIVFVVCVTVPAIVGAQSTAPAPFPEFTFRRVTPPTANSTAPRINIQIAPASSPLAASPMQVPAAVVTPAPQPSAMWFWSAVSATGIPSTARFHEALLLLDNAPEAARLGTARVADLQPIVQAHGAAILQATIGTQVSPALVLAIISVESGGRVDAQSGAGAQGLMQLIPATAARFDVIDSFDPTQNISGGVAYLDWLMAEFDGDPVLVLAAYNSGEGAVRLAQGVPNYPETRNYVPKVLATWQVARLMCLTPPELVWEGCVFQAM
jgi:soluble lytic murein transglycosylase-like protein